MDASIHRVGLRLSLCLAAGSASSFSIGTGLADTTTLHPFVLLRFWTCYRPPKGFPPEVSPFALKGFLFPTFLCCAEIQLAVRRRTGSPCPQTPSLGATHHRKLSVSHEKSNVLWCYRLREATVEEAIHRVGRRLGLRLATDSASSLSIGTGLAGTITFPLFMFPRFWSCYRSLGCFHPRVRPFALGGLCFRPPPAQQEFDLPLDGAPHAAFLSCGTVCAHFPTEEHKKRSEVALKARTGAFHSFAWIWPLRMNGPDLD